MQPQQMQPQPRNPKVPDINTIASSSVHIDDEVKHAVFKMTTGGVLTFLSAYTLNDWVAIVTIIYFILQIGLLCPKYFSLLKTISKQKKHNKGRKFGL